MRKSAWTPLPAQPLLVRTEVVLGAPRGPLKPCLPRKIPQRRTPGGRPSQTGCPWVRNFSPNGSCSKKGRLQTEKLGLKIKPAVKAGLPGPPVTTQGRYQAATVTVTATPAELKGMDEDKGATLPPTLGTSPGALPLTDLEVRSLPML
ncbi:hypothetical protein CB1_000372018 [Camelus ferus]|nr:hypothetical protein CB1_000372018 [Camelus ferus]